MKDEIQTQLENLDMDLGFKGPQWLDASGYLNAWTRLHEAEEDLLLVDSEDEVVAAGLADLLRLNDSDIPAKTMLVQEIKESIPFISRAGATFASVVSAAVTAKLDPVAGATVRLSTSVARRRIRCVRMAINREREDQWDQVVRSRNGLLIAAAFALMIGYLLVLLSIGFRSEPTALASALVFALVGALVSAVHQLFIRSGAQSEVEDFGYSNTKLLIAPILSGLVAVLAIVFLTQTQFIVSGQTLGGAFTSWQGTFDWRKNPSAIGIATLFGFAPSLLFSLLQSRVKGALASLKSSSVGGGKTK